MILRLLLDNKDSLVTSISLCALPKTFKDAIYITRRLGLGYLWIDSLAIIQDSVEDWRREASTMADVYQNSYLTIAATNSKDSSGGCFRERSHYFVQPTKIPLAWEGYNDTPFLWRKDHFEYRRELSESPLLVRGWVLQERFFQLEFSTMPERSSEPIWECTESIVSETYPDGIPLHDPSDFMMRALSLDKSTWQAATSQSQELNVHETWYKLAEIVSAAGFTFATDKLIALSGLASEFYLRQLQSRDSYVAGMWRSSLPDALCWRQCPRLSGIIENSAEYTAPSWAWASTKAQIAYDVYSDYIIQKKDTDDDADILNIQLTTADGNPYGQVTKGSLTIRGLAAYLTLAR